MAALLQHSRFRQIKSMPDVNAVLGQDAALLDRWLTDYFEQRASLTTAPRLVEAMRYSALNGGKRMRASLVLSASRMVTRLNGQPEPGPACVAVAAAVELVHAYSLVHDDLPAMDDADLRRGVASSHIAFDEATAILAGDALQTEAFYILSGPGLCADPAVQLKLVRLLSHASGDQGMAGGQMLDLLAEDQNLGLADTRQMQDMKTGALIKAAAVMGIVASGGSEELEDAISAYAQALGFAFQIADDLLDYAAAPDLLGKPSGRDAEQGKASLVSLLGLDQARQMAASLIDEATDQLTPYGTAADELIALARFAIDRKH